MNKKHKDLVPLPSPERERAAPSDANHNISMPVGEREELSVSSLSCLSLSVLEESPTMQCVSGATALLRLLQIVR